MKEEFFILRNRIMESTGGKKVKDMAAIGAEMKDHAADLRAFKGLLVGYLCLTDCNIYDKERTFLFTLRKGDVIEVKTSNAGKTACMVSHCPCRHLPLEDLLSEDDVVECLLPLHDYEGMRHLLKCVPKTS